MESDESQIPRSARLDFTLKSSKQVAELPDYIELMEECDIYINTVKCELKQKILKVLNMEIKTLQTQILEHFVKGIF